MKERLRFESELSNLGLAEYDTPLDGKKQKNVVLVAGFDYEFSGAEFGQMCDRRMKLLIRRNPKLKLKFTIFDVGKGTVKTKEKDAQGKITETLVKTFDPVGRSNYDMTVPKKEKVFVTGSGVMSILDIYKHIQDLGKTEPESLIELSIFSHGWHGGPVLVNSFSGAGDKDGRPEHFDDATRVAELKKVFDKNGVFWIWGCNFAKAFLIIFAVMRRSSKYRSSGLRNDVEFKLSFSEGKKTTTAQQELEHRIYTSIWKILGGSGVAPTNASNRISFTKTIKFEDLKAAFIGGLETTFSQKAAVALGITAHGALPGTYSDYERGGNKLMLVPRESPPYADNFSRISGFYRTYLMIQMAPENRGYAKYPF
jgi:hypothetical protein